MTPFVDRLAGADPARMTGRWRTSSWFMSIVAHSLLLVLLLSALPRVVRGLPSPDLEDAREVGILLKSESDSEVVFENAEDAFRTKVEESSLDPPELETLTQSSEPLPHREELPQLDIQSLGVGSAPSEPGGARQRISSDAIGGPTRTKFWNVESIGQSFVFVIDRSASMSHRGALAMAKKELFQSLSSLSEAHRFQVIFYNTEAFSLSIDGAGLIPATPANIARAKREIERVTPEGGTDHFKPLALAFRMTPEVVYFLTDADMLSGDDVSRLTQLNRQAKVPATLFAIEFGNGPSLPTEKPLRRLAADNDGSYSYLDIQSLGPSVGSPQ